MLQKMLDILEIPDILYTSSQAKDTKMIRESLYQKSIDLASQNADWLKRTKRNEGIFDNLISLRMKKYGMTYEEAKSQVYDELRYF